MRDRDKLLESLNKAILDNNNSRAVLTKVEKFLFARDVGIGEITPYWMGNEDLSAAPDIILFSILYA